MLRLLGPLGDFFCYVLFLVRQGDHSLGLGFVGVELDSALTVGLALGLALVLALASLSTSVLLMASRVKLR